MNIILLFVTFSVLTLLSFCQKEKRSLVLSRQGNDWLIDITGLITQGIFIPAIPFLIVPVLVKIFPTSFQSIYLTAIEQFILGFIILDYFYYWNHRLFHKKGYWSLHKLHHSSRHLDILATSRNSIITSFFIVYVWGQTLAMFLLKDATPFMLSLALTFSLDLWRHSGMMTFPFIKKILGPYLILPEQHVLHHSLLGRHKNYGANLNIWDRIHGTFSPQEVDNNHLEKKQFKHTWRELCLPWTVK